MTGNSMTDLLVVRRRTRRRTRSRRRPPPTPPRPPTQHNHQHRPLRRHNTSTTTTTNNTTDTDDRQQILASSGHSSNLIINSNNNNSTNQTTIGINNTTANNILNTNTITTNNVSSSSNNNSYIDNDTRIFKKMSHLLSASFENGDLSSSSSTAGLMGNNSNNTTSNSNINYSGPDLTLSAQENFKHGVGLTGIGCELLSRDNNNASPYPIPTTTTITTRTNLERNRSTSSCTTTSSSSSCISNNNNNNNIHFTTTTNNNNNGLYANGSTVFENVLLPVTTTVEDKGNVLPNLPSSFNVAFSNPNISSGTSSIVTTTSSFSSSSSTIKSYNNDNKSSSYNDNYNINFNKTNHNGTSTTAHPTKDLKTNSIGANSTSQDISFTGSSCLDSHSSSNTSGSSIINDNNVYNNNNNINNNSSTLSLSNNNNHDNTDGCLFGSLSPSLALVTPDSPPPPHPKQLKQVTSSIGGSGGAGAAAGDPHGGKLKDLLLLHIDFIHHQQDLLLQKDKEIGSLKSENETLKCRLDRMERRLSILKQKGDPVNSHHHHLHHNHHLHHPHSHHPHQHPHLTAATLAKNQASNDGVTTTTSTTMSTGDNNRASKRLNFLKRRERKFGVDSQNVQKKKESLKSKNHSSSSLTKTKLSYRGGGGTVNRCQERLTDNEDDNEEEEDEADVILRTDNLYYVSYYEPPFMSEKVLVNIRHTNDEIKSDGSKEIPHWRLRPVANCYTLEGTENLEDEVFTKRHQKPELEEKRRKRWDLQRMREQKLFERLRERGKPYPENMRDEHELMRSFYPSLDDITHIEIADKVPVMAFGHPIPYIKPTDFELPWELGEWPSTSSSSGEDNRHPKHRRVKRK